MAKQKGQEIIRLENVCKNYQMGEEIVRAVCEVDLSINKGEFIAIMGPSGSGKSTLMNLVGSLDVPTKGKIFLGGKNIADLSESELAQVRGEKIGFIFQQFNLINSLTSKENVMLPLMFQNMSFEERKERAEKVLSLVELEHRMDYYPNQLSGGQQQRVAIARALANEPEVVLADEPTGNLDTETGETVLSFLQKLHKKGKTIIMVTHEPRLAREHAELTYHLVDGKIDRVIEGNNHNRKKNK